ncbi:MAG: LysM peptidoglycan-binding domain-containing protein [Eubacteriales bacterium]|nr:LysM peptidoglycan-binding domain-containing protein [Eubacteriales bacterium]
MSRGRWTAVGTVYGGSGQIEYLSEKNESFTYTDVASGESDSISITLGKWRDGWQPQKGDRIAHMCRFSNWEADGDVWELQCGDFQLDDITISGRPLSIEVKGTSIPASASFNAELRTKTWEKVTVREIAEEIAGRAGIKLLYDADDIEIQSMEQDEQTDCKFLYSVCEQYGLAMKVFSSRLIIFDEGIYEAKVSAATLRESDFLQWSYNTTVGGTYTGAKLSYSDPGKGKDQKVTVGGGERILNINREADSAEDARKKALAELNNANKRAVTFSGNLFPRREIAAGACISLEGFSALGVPDGNYYLDKVVTKVSGKGASSQAITAHWTGYRADGAEVLLDSQLQEGSGETIAYTVEDGDTLWLIAQKITGNPLMYEEIYELNKETIESEAVSRGKKDSGHGHWIFAGTILQIPVEEDEEDEDE